MNREESALDQAVKRLDRAVAQLADRHVGASAVDPDGVSGDGLAAELAQARAREKALEIAGAEASVALGRAIGQIEAMLTAPQTEDA